MEFKLTEVTGLAQAMTSLKMSKRNYNYEDHMELIRKIRWISDYRGAILKGCPYDAPMDKYASMKNGRPVLQTYDEVYQEALREMDKLAKWGAGVGQEGAWKDDGHETLLRYIDLSFVTLGLHRGAQDDLDAHSKRFDNRVVRASTRLGNFAPGERSSWYENRIRSIEDMMLATGLGTPPAEYTDGDGVTWKYTSSGYVRADLVGAKCEKDCKRGNYPLSIPGDAIWKIDLFDLRHVYMRRNEYTHANPELRDGIEQLADQVEEALPGDLGKLVRYDYALIPDTDAAGNLILPLDPAKMSFNLVHVMDVRKVYFPRENPNL